MKKNLLTITIIIVSFLSGLLFGIKGRELPKSQDCYSLPNIDSIIFDTKKDAEYALSQALDLNRQYGQVTVADVYGLAGKNSTFLDSQYGWENLTADNSGIKITWKGYIIKPPKPILLTNSIVSNLNPDAHYEVNGIVFKTYEEAEGALIKLSNTIRDYQNVSVSDLYNLGGLTPSYSDYKYGWTELSSATVSKGNGGYYINLPVAKELY
jgi:hypothetical protein